MGFAAINAVAHDGAEHRARESLEAQEHRIADTYATALRLVEEGRRLEAQVRLLSLFGRSVLHCCIYVVCKPVLSTQLGVI